VVPDPCPSYIRQSAIGKYILYHFFHALFSDYCIWRKDNASYCVLL
jgi:hypothetical protein